MNSTNLTNDIHFGTVTLEGYRTSNFVLLQILIPTISLIGFVGNGLCVFILAENKEKYAFATYLKALTIVDSCLLMGAIVKFILTLCERYITTDAFRRFNMYTTLWIGRFLSFWLMHVAAVLISIISLERFVAVLYPLKIKSFVLDIQPIPVVATTMILHAGIMIPYMVVYRVGSSLDPDKNTTSYFVERFYSSEEEKKIMSIFFIVVNFVNYFIPLLVVVCTTTAIVISLRLKAVKKTTRGKWCMEKDKMTMVLVVIASFFAINNFMSIVMTTVSLVYPDFVVKESYLYLMCTDILLVLICINSANDFAIYILSSRQFRKQFLRKFLFCRRPELRDHLPEVTADDDAVVGVSETEIETLSGLQERYSNAIPDVSKY